MISAKIYKGVFMKYLKYFLVSILAIIGTFTFAACGKSNSNDDPLTNDYSSNEILIAYFSRTNNTEKVAGYIKDYSGGDLFEITPSDPYTADDIDYNNHNSRTYLEDKNDSARPGISNQVDSIENYKIIFLGYPIWYGKAPKIIYTFLETYSSKLNNTIIIPFCTSASSGMGNSATNLHSLAPNAAWKNGQRFSSTESKTNVENWLKGLNIKFAEQ